ncbi:MAG TPA: DUF2550 domain-containing protein [Aeromicrobium sp.]|nr:DUF2550 domain-containing protein [Aeromicrobium sp.]
MPFWWWLVDSLALIVFFGFLAIGALIFRRRWISRMGATFELCVNHGIEHSARGWMLGVAVYGDTEITWYRTFSLSPKARHRFVRGEVMIEGRRDPEGAEDYALHRDSVIIGASAADGVQQFALSQNSLTGLLAWLEAAPPGRGVNRVV